MIPIHGEGELMSDLDLSRHVKTAALVGPHWPPSGHHRRKLAVYRLVPKWDPSMSNAMILSEQPVVSC